MDWRCPPSRRRGRVLRAAWGAKTADGLHLAGPAALLAQARGQGLGQVDHGLLAFAGGLHHKAQPPPFLLDLHGDCLRCIGVPGFLLQALAQGVDQVEPAIAALQAPAHGAGLRVGVAVLEELWVALAHQGVKFWGHGAGFFWCDGRHHLWRCDELCRWQVLIDFGLQPLYGRR